MCIQITFSVANFNVNYHLVSTYNILCTLSTYLGNLRFVQRSNSPPHLYHSKNNYLLFQCILGIWMHHCTLDQMNNNHDNCNDNVDLDEDGSDTFDDETVRHHPHHHRIRRSAFQFADFDLACNFRRWKWWCELQRDFPCFLIAKRDCPRGQCHLPRVRWCEGWLWTYD